MKKVIAVCCIAALSACASAPNLFLASDPIDVSTEELAKYWIPETDTFKFNIYPSQLPTSATEGYVKVRYLIDSNGNTFNPEVIESSPEGIWNVGGLKAASKQRYLPAASNGTHTPVYYTQTITFKFGS